MSAPNTIRQEENDERAPSVGQPEHDEREVSPAASDSDVFPINLPMNAIAEVVRAETVADIDPQAISDIVAAIKAYGFRPLLPPSAQGPPRQEAPLPPRQRAPETAAARQKKMAADAEKERQRQLFSSLLTRAEDIQKEPTPVQAVEGEDAEVSGEANEG